MGAQSDTVLKICLLFKELNRKRFVFKKQRRRCSILVCPSLLMPNSLSTRNLLETMRKMSSRRTCNIDGNGANTYVPLVFNNYLSRREGGLLCGQLKRFATTVLYLASGTHILLGKLSYDQIVYWYEGFRSDSYNCKRSMMQWRRQTSM
jgi:hypothetical protein